MLLMRWEELPPEMKNEEVRQYYDLLRSKQAGLILKRLFDIVVSAIMLAVLSPAFLVIAIAIKLDSKGPVFFRQVRVTQYNKTFRIFKFRTMVEHAENGAQVTCSDDVRITCLGRLIRRCRLDEVSQLIDVLRGTMTFVGTRPEVPKYVEYYTQEMMATLLLPAGVTSLTSIYYKDEARLLEEAENSEQIYVTRILPEKMKWNLAGIREQSFKGDIKLMWMTVASVFGKKYEVDKLIEKNAKCVKSEESI